MSSNQKEPGYRWRFVRTAGFDQVLIETGADILALPQLDQKLWAALSCPANGMEFDNRTLAHLDTDKDGHIRVPEILSAVSWIGARLKNCDDLIKSAPELPLAAINEDTPEGRQMLASARRVLTNLGKGDSPVISPDDTADTARIFADTRFNGDGIVPASSADDAQTSKVIEAIIDCVGTVPDRSGKAGVAQTHVDDFFAEAQAFSDWWARAESDAAILPLGEATHEAAEVLRTLKTKIEDFFTRCRLAAYDAHAASALNPDGKDYELLHTTSLSASTDALVALPLAQVAANGDLPLEGGVNPAWKSALSLLAQKVVAPLCGSSRSLTEKQWEDLCARFAPYEAWLGSKQGSRVESLDLARVREILSGGFQAKIADLLVQDKALETESNAIEQVDKLVLLHRDLFTLLNNFVSLRDFYSQKASAVFQAGTLYVDGRSCDLCVRVADMTRHGALANLSGTYLLYCDCVRRGTNEKMTIAAAVTAGDVDNLMVGRNGVFYDRRGQDWDATVVKIIEHPISIRQAFWLPYKRASRMISEQVEKFAAAQDKAVAEKSSSTVAGGAQTVQEGSKTSQAFDIAKFAGIFAAIGLAVGAIGSALAAVVTGFLSLTPWQMPLALAGVMLIVSGPSMLLAYMKLRRRNLAPILDANGWAVNTKARINISFGGSLTHIAELPPGAERSLHDPYAEAQTPWGFYLFMILLLAVLAYLWQQGVIQAWLE